MDSQNHLIGDYLPNEKSVNLVMLQQKNVKVIRNMLYEASAIKKVATMPTFEKKKSFNPHYLC